MPDDDSHGEQSWNEDAAAEANHGDQQGHVVRDMISPSVFSKKDEARGPRPVRFISGPARAERARHAVTHTPCIPWCAECVDGAGEHSPHDRIERGVAEDASPIVCIGDGVLGPRDEVVEGGSTEVQGVAKCIGCFDLRTKMRAFNVVFGNGTAC